jgi:hypothetical protein
MSFQVMYRDRRDAQSVGHAATKGRPGEQGAHQSWTGGIGHPRELCWGGVGTRKCLTYKRKQSLDMVPGCKLGHYPAIQAMQIDLAVQFVCQQTALVVKHSHRTFVTG